LREAAYETPTTGTATPLSNDATFLGYPSTEHANAIVQPEEAIRLDLLAQKANADQVVDIPAAIGSCWYIKRDCLDATGLFRDDLFAQGHGEENDFCIRARHLGWRHVAAPGIFVAHIDGRPASSAEHYLIERNTRLLNRLHPGYDKLISESRTVDPIGESRRRIDTELWRTLRSGNESVLLITHDRRGGVQRRVAERAASLRADGLRPIVLSPIACSTGRGCVLSDGLEGGTPNLRFAIPAELDLLAELLKADRPQRGEVHHLIGHDHALLDLFRRLGIPYEVVIHDYNWICPRINLIGSAKRYCAEPDLVACEACVADAGTANDEDTAPRALRERSLAELAGASRVVVPSQDTATRLQRYFPHVPTDVVPWEDDSGSSSPKSAHIASDDVRRICVVGAISIEKGYEVLLACARDASRRDLKLEFHLVGESCDDARLLATERVHITGRFDEHEALQLIHAQRAQLGWLPSLWPETWCYALTRMWQAGLKTVAFDIGAQAERIRRTGRGWLYPLGLEPATLNARLLQHADASNPSMPKDAR
jgi:glycosyltransferase involved in cell wall biosynthesis